MINVWNVLDELQCIDTTAIVYSRECPLIFAHFSY